MDTVSTETICAKSYKEKRRTRKSDKVVVKGECQSLEQSNTDTRLADNVTERNLILEGLQSKEEAQSVGTKINTGPTEVISEGCDIGNRKKKRKTSSNIMDKGSTENPAGKMKKKRKGKKANLVGDVQNELDARSTDNLDQENLTIKISKAGLTHMNTGSAEDCADVNLIIEHQKTLNEAQSMGQDTMDTLQLAENIVQGNVAGIRRKKRNKNKAKVNDEDHREMDTRSTENLIEENATLNELGITDAAQGVTQTQTNTGSTDNVAERNVTVENLKVQDEIQSIDQAKLISPSEDLAEGNVTVKRKKTRKQTRKAKVDNEFSGSMDEGSIENMAEVDLHIKIPETRDEVPSMGPKVMDAGSTEDLMKGVRTFENPKVKHKGESMDKVLKQRVHVQDNMTIENPKVQDGIQSIDQAKRIMPTEDFSEGNVTVKSKKKRKKTKKANVKDEFSSRMDAELSKNLAEVDANIRIPETRDKVPSMGLKVIDAGSTENLAMQGRNAISTCNACSMKDTEDLCLRMAPFASVRRKLLVLDINGLLADVVFPAPKHDRGEDIRFYGRAVFTRPFCGDFLKFCFQNFNVGIWSSRSKKIIDKVVSYLLGDQKDKLLFCWDMAHSTTTGFKTLENRHKPLVCKELRKIWEKDDPSWPWKKGDYNESNTLLLDDSPYKALLNPLHTAIFPHPFQYSDKNDNSLGPGGDLRVYLEGLLASENVQKYVEQHPFGQSPISEEDISWEFYDRVLKQISKDKTSLVETQIDHQEPPR